MVSTYLDEMLGYAPGLILLIEAAKRAQGEGVRRIDFGRGDQSYKLRFSTTSTALCEGSIERAGAAHVLRAGTQGVAALGRALPLGRYETYPRRILGRLISNVRLPSA